MRFAQLVALAGVLAVGLRADAGAADELWLRTGQRLDGKLALGSDGGLRWTVNGTPLAPADLQQVRFPPGRVRPLTPTHRVCRSDSQRLSGEWLAWDGQALQLRTAWAGRVVVPREWIAGIENPYPGLAFRDGFERDLAAWKLGGRPAVKQAQHVSGRGSLLLDAAGQAAEHALDEPVAAGRVEAWFCAPDQPRGLRWSVEMEFGDGKQAQPWRFVCADRQAHFAVEASLASERVPPLARTPGWHRLSVRFRREYLLAGVDDGVAWSSAERGPVGPLRKVRLRCDADSSSLAPQGFLYFDDVMVLRTPDTAARGPAPAGQDEVWLEAGDQWFGRVEALDEARVQLRGRFGRRDFRWDALRGVFLAHDARAASPPARDAVRLGLASGNGETDELEGSVLALDEREIKFRHAALGDLTIDRAAARYLRRPSP